MASLVTVPPGTKVGILTSGGLAPCLSAAVGYLIEKVRQRKLMYVLWEAQYVAARPPLCSLLIYNLSRN